MSQLHFMKTGARASCVAALFAVHGMGIAQAAPFQQVTANKSNIANPTPPAAPNNAFFAASDVSNTAQAFGPGNHKIVITSITLTNLSTSLQSVFVFQPIFASGVTSCSAAVEGGAEPAMNIEVQPKQTISVPFPSGLIFHGFTPNCVAVQGQTTGVDAYLDGYTQ
jgi:hypothetical protein